MGKTIGILWRAAKWVSLALVLGWAACEAAVAVASRGRTFDRIADVPARETGLVLGTSKFVGPGRPNRHYRYRIDAAAELFKAGKVRRLIVSGNGMEAGYNEPRMMKADLVERGVPADRIVKDDAGLRTYDSVVRAGEIFGAADCIVVSQPAHNERAIFIGRSRGQDLLGWNARAVGFFADPRTAVREHLARIRAVIDAFVSRRESGSESGGNALSFAAPPR